MQRKLIVIIASVALVVSLVSIWHRLRPTATKIDRTPIIGTAAGVGEVLAEKTIEAVQNQGRIVLVTDHDYTQSSTPRDLRWETFQAALKKHGAISIVATELVEFDPSEPMVSGCPSAAFKTILDRHADVGAIVFFVDLPEWVRVAGSIPDKLTTKLIAVDNMGGSLNSHYSGYFTGGVLFALIARRSPVADQPATPGTPREWFDKYYQVFTPQNFESLPQ